MKIEHQRILLDVVQWLSIILMVVSLIYSVYVIGYSFGKANGRVQEQEDTKRIHCEVKFGGTPQSEIEGDCLKYFKMQEGN